MNRPRTIAEVLPLRRRHTPNRIGLQELDEGGQLHSVTYEQMARWADGFAARLSASGARPGDTVAILMPNGARWTYAYFGIFRLGAVAVPLEYALLAERCDLLSYTLDHSDAGCVICMADDAPALRDAAGRERELVPADHVEPARPTTSIPPRPTVEPHQVAQILYTSGTTGPKKGVVLTHGNAIFDVQKCCDRFGVRGCDVLPALLPYHHAYPLTTTVVLPAYAGACMAVGDIRERRSRAVLRTCRPTVLVGVPRVFDAMRKSIGNLATRAGKRAGLERGRALSAAVKRWTGINPGKIVFRRVHLELFGGPQLRFCVSGGARISPDTLRAFFQLGIPIVQGWGMTELSPVAAVQKYSGRRFWFTRHYERKAGSIGTALAGTAISLVAPESEQLTLDEPDRGEMLVRGPHVMRGYHKDPELSRRRLAPGGLRSGDVALRDSDGELRIVGRIKHVIVLANGKKVFPEADLHEPLSRCPSIDQFAVRPIADEGSGERIGIIVRPDVEELRCRNVTSIGRMYATIKAEIDSALRPKPSYMKRYDFCLTEWDDNAAQYQELVSTSMGEPSPLRNSFREKTAYSQLKSSEEPVPWADGRS